MREEKVKDFIFSIIEKIGDFVPAVRVFKVGWSNLDTNSGDGDFAVTFNPLMFEADFLVYKNVLSSKLTEPEKLEIQRDIAHEYGHCLVWELFGKFDDIEKAATRIGDTILELYLETEKYDSLRSKEKK